MATLVPFGVNWLDANAMQARQEEERSKFVRWIDQLRIPEVHRLVLTVLLEMVDRVEFMDGRCAGFTYPAEVGRRAGIPDGIDDVLRDLITGRCLYVHPAAEVYKDGRPGIIFRLRRPGVVLSAKSAGPLWGADTRPQLR